MIVSSSVPSALPQNLGQQSSSSASRGLTIEFRPGANNVNSGNRSDNTVEVTVTTPNRQATTEVSREQLIGYTENRLQQRALDSVAGDNTRDPALLGLAAVRSGAISSSDLNQVATARNQQQLAEAYLGAAGGTNQGGYQAPSNQGPTTDPVQIANNAVDAYIRQTLFFSDTAQASPIVDVLA